MMPPDFELSLREVLMPITRREMCLLLTAGSFPAGHAIDLVKSGRYRRSAPTTNILAVLPSQVSAGNGVNACSRAAIVSTTAK